VSHELAIFGKLTFKKFANSLHQIACIFCPISTSLLEIYHRRHVLYRVLQAMEAAQDNNNE
jgi:hypothetical protein